MAPRLVKELTDIEIDEISLVDVPANQHAKVRIAKRASEEDIVPEQKIFNENGQELDPETLKLGDNFFDEDGLGYVVVPLDEDDEYDDLLEDEQLTSVGKSFADEVREELSKAFTQESHDEVISKAAARVEAAERAAAEAVEIAKSERNKRLMGKYVEVAKSYNIPGDPEELAPVLMHMSEVLPIEECRVIHKALKAAGATIFEEIGAVGGGDNDDVMSRVSAFLESDTVSKAAGDSISKAEQIESFFSQNPDAYDQYRAEQMTR